MNNAATKIFALFFFLAVAIPTANAVRTLVYDEEFNSTCPSWQGGTCVNNSYGGYYETTGSFSTMRSPNLSFSTYQTNGYEVVFTVWINDSNNGKILTNTRNGSVDAPAHDIETDSGDMRIKFEPGFPTLTSSLPFNVNSTWNVTNAKNGSGATGNYTRTFMSFENASGNNTLINNVIAYNVSNLNGDFLHFISGTLIGYMRIMHVQVYDLNTPDTTAPSFNVTNDSITSSSFRVMSNATEASNMTVCYGTTVNLGTCLYNTTSAANLTLNVTGLNSNTVYFYNVTRTDSSANSNITGTYNVTTSVAAANSIPVLRTLSLPFHKFLNNLISYPDVSCGSSVANCSNAYDKDFTSFAYNAHNQTIATVIIYLNYSLNYSDITVANSSIHYKYLNTTLGNDGLELFNVSRGLYDAVGVGADAQGVIVQRVVDLPSYLGTNNVIKSLFIAGAYFANTLIVGQNFYDSYANTSYQYHYAANDITPQANFTDADGDTLTYACTWYKNGAYLSSFQYPNTTTNQTIPRLANTSTGSGGGINNPENALAIDGSLTRFLFTDDAIELRKFNFPINNSIAVTGIQVDVLSSIQFGTGGIGFYNVSLSKNNGSTYGQVITTAQLSSGQTNLTWKTVGGDGNLWNDTWNPIALSNDSFSVKVLYYEQGCCAPVGYVDAVNVTIYYAGGAQQGILYNLTTLNHTNYQTGDNVTLQCSVSDYQNTTTTNTTTYTISDKIAPLIENATVSPAVGNANDLITLSVQASDRDNASNITSVTANISRNGVLLQTASMIPIINGNFTYVFSLTSNNGNYTVDYVATDAGGNTNSTTGVPFIITTTQTGNPAVGGGGGGGSIVINQTNVTLNDTLQIVPSRINTYAFVTNRNATYEQDLVTNRDLERCEILNDIKNSIVCTVNGSIAHISVNVSSSVELLSEVYDGDVTLYSTQGESENVNIRITAFSSVVKDAEGEVIGSKVFMIALGLLVVIGGIWYFIRPEEHLVNLP